MKNKLNVYSNEKVRNFLISVIPQYELIFMSIDMIEHKLQSNYANIIVLNYYKEAELVNFKSLNDNYLIVSNLNKNKLHIENRLKFLNTPIPTTHLRNRIESFIQNLEIQFHDISIVREKITNLNNNSFCYLTKVELEILSYLIKEKEASKNFIKENILNIKSDIETNSLDSHLTRIRKKMNKINTVVKIQTKSEKLSIKL
tara:strand:+ start:797 stop:1399 length:603 start_codon:yes stop_codon:yes gene_type:complete